MEELDSVRMLRDFYVCCVLSHLETSARDLLETGCQALVQCILVWLFSCFLKGDSEADVILP